MFDRGISVCGAPQLELAVDNSANAARRARFVSAVHDTIRFPRRAGGRPRRRRHTWRGCQLVAPVGAVNLEVSAVAEGVDVAVQGLAVSGSMEAAGSASALPVRDHPISNSCPTL